MSETDQATSQQIPEPETEHQNVEKGIDVSHWQGKVDWSKVAKAGVKHVCIKMTEGSTFVDPSFVTFWNDAKKAKINVHCYHYFRALHSTPQKQMNNIKRNLSTVDFDPSKNILCIDVEKDYNEEASSDEMAKNLMDLLKLIGNDPVLKCRRPMIYTSSGYWDSNVSYNLYEFNAYPLWVAHWGTKTPQLPKPWSEWTWWQYSSKGKVDGIANDVDLDWVKV